VTMKGIVFVKFLELVEENWSPDFAEQLIEECNLPSGGAYTAVGTYPHEEIVTLVVKLSEMSNIPVPDLLKTYGHFLFGQFAALYPGFFEGVDSSIDFVGQIEDVIHVEVRKLYPDAELPKFEVIERTPDLLVIKYRSERHLGDLAEGLILSAIDHFKEKGTVNMSRQDLVEPGDPVCFRLERVAT